MVSLQKESEWEQSFDENFPDFGWCLRTDVGVNPSKDRVKSFIKEVVEVALVKGYEDGYKIGHWEGFEEGRNFGLKEREKEIAEEVEKYALYCQKESAEQLGRENVMLAYDMDSRQVAAKKILQILKH